jgi:hypothetical protein
MIPIRAIPAKIPKIYSKKSEPVKARKKPEKILMITIEN